MASNGSIPTSQMRQVDGWAWLAPGAAAAWLLFAFAATMRWGIRPTITSPDGAYRSYARQLWWWVRRFIKRVVVARPGSSNHGLGMAIDIYNWARFPRAAFVALARQHGFVFDTASENWHVHYLGAANYGASTTTASTGTTPITNPKDEDMKPRLYTVKGRAGYRILETARNGSFPMNDIRTGKALTLAQVQEVWKFINYDPSYYPNGPLNAAIIKDAGTETVIVGAITGVLAA